MSVRHTGRYICSHIGGCCARMASVLKDIIEIRVNNTTSVFKKICIAIDKDLDIEILFFIEYLVTY